MFGIEDAKKIYDKGWKFEYCTYDYTIKEYLKKAEKILNRFGLQLQENETKIKIENTIDEIKQDINIIEKQYNEYEQKIKEIEQRNKEIMEKLLPIKELSGLNINIQDLITMKYIKFRYGNVPNENIIEIEKELQGDIKAIYYKLKKEEKNTWLIYITTEEYANDVDAFFNMQEFERILLPNDFDGLLSNLISDLKLEYNENEIIQGELDKELKYFQNEKKNKLISYYEQLKEYELVNKLKKYIMHDKKQTFYMVIWVPETNIDYIVNMLKQYEYFDYSIRDGKKEEIKEPTKLRNNKLIKPFEMLVKMYGIPNVKELDPTVFVAITSFIMFGFMFGDIGHGAILLLIGLLLMKKKVSLGPVMVAFGISSIIFGFLYGSIFGREDILKSKLISPMENINTMLISGVVVGSVFILIAMILNIVNGIRNKEIKKIFFDKNGLARIFAIWICIICYS
ncbi:MAG: hypothetical protein HFJ20_03965 [Clostridia bacterium]|nr:hypothetical protein [Clostridia bacterium]